MNEQTHPRVRAAIIALDSFGAVTVAEARTLLGMWGRREQLTAADVAEILAYYDDGRTEVTR